MRESILGILAGGHPAHVKIFKSFTDKMYFALGPWVPGKRHSLFKKLLKYVFYGLFIGVKRPPVIFIEGAIPSLIIGTVLRTLSRSSYVIALVAEDAFLKSQKSPKCLKSRILKKWFNKNIDAVIAIGPLIADQIKQFNFPGPVFIMYPEMGGEQSKRLLSLNYSTESKVVLHIGGGEVKYKGIDLTLQAAKRLEEYDFVVLGYERSTINEEIPSVVTMAGRVKDILPFLEKAALVVHPGRGDAFPVSTLEAMAAGVPVLLSKYTGTSCIMEEINPLFVRETSVSDIIRGIDWFFSLKEGTRIEYSNRVRSSFKDKLKIYRVKNRKSILEIRSLVKTILAK